MFYRCLTCLLLVLGGAVLSGGLSLDAVSRLIWGVGDTDLSSSWLHHEQKLRAQPHNPHVLVNLANVGVRGMEQHIKMFPFGGWHERQEVAFLAYELLQQAASTAHGLGHFGAHYSLGLLYKLYPDLLSTSSSLAPISRSHNNSDKEAYYYQASARGYRHMCQSQESYVASLSQSYHEQCQEIKIVRNWEGLPTPKPIVEAR